MRGDRPVLLLSGLPLERKPSFYRQLDTLAAAWRQSGRNVLVGGPVPGDAESSFESRSGIATRGSGAAHGPRWRLEGAEVEPLAFEELRFSIAPAALIVLGYPDQFPFLQGSPSPASLPCCLWSQLSRPPLHPLPAAPLYIPLTEKTALHLRTAGCSKIGPVIPHGVDTLLFSPLSERERCGLRRRHGCAGAFVVGTVANNSRRKRLDLIVRSFALFSRQRTDSRLLIKTDRPVSLDGIDLPALIARENVGDRVEIIAADLSGAKMAELYNRMDLFLNLSEWEGFCIPVAEAMACGVPVVSPPIQGPGEILPYPDTLVPNGLFREEGGTLLYRADTQGVSRILSSLAGEQGLRERLSRQGRDAALSIYDIRRIAMRWEQVLQRM